jgi:hypothetical protein
MELARGPSKWTESNHMQARLAWGARPAGIFDRIWVARQATSKGIYAADRSITEFFLVRRTARTSRGTEPCAPGNGSRRSSADALITRYITHAAIYMELVITYCICCLIGPQGMQCWNSAGGEYDGSMLGSSWSSASSVMKVNLILRKNQRWRGQAQVLLFSLKEIKRQCWSADSLGG